MICVGVLSKTFVTLSEIGWINSTHSLDEMSETFKATHGVVMINSHYVHNPTPTTNAVAIDSRHESLGQGLEQLIRVLPVDDK